MTTTYTLTHTVTCIGYGPLASRCFPGCASDAPDPLADDETRQELSSTMEKALDPEGKDDPFDPWFAAFRAACVLHPERMLRKRPPKERLARTVWVALALQINPRKVSDALAQEAETWDTEQCALFNAITDVLENYDVSSFDE